jgi:hypothetical protein
MKKLGLGTIAVALIDKLHECRKQGLIIVETGTLRDAEHEPGWETEERSTLAIAQWMASRKDSGIIPENRFYSIDNSAGNLAISKKVLSDAGVDKYVQHIRADSVAALKTELNTFIDFALLDSSTEPKTILAELEQVHLRIRWPGVVLIDDVYDRGEVNKGSLAIAYAQKYHFKHFRIGNCEAIAFGLQAETLCLEVAHELQR